MADYTQMSREELKKVAKDHRPKIKYYYIKSRQELIDLLTMPALPESFRIEKLTIAELRKEAKARGVRDQNGRPMNVWTARKKDLLEALYPSPQKNDENDDGGQKHNAPEKGEGEDVGVEV